MASLDLRGSQQFESISYFSQGVWPRTDKSQINHAFSKKLIDFTIGFPLNEFNISIQVFANMIQNFAVIGECFLGRDHGPNRHSQRTSIVQSFLWLLE